MIRLRNVRWRSWKGWRSGSADATSGSDVGVGEARLALVHPRDELLVDPVVERWLLVFGQAPLPATVRALRRIESAVDLPLLEGVVVRQLRPPERVLEVGQGVRRAEEMLARAAAEHRVEGIPVVGDIDALDVGFGHRRLVLVEHELLVPDREAALEPARSVKVEVDSS